MQINLKLVHLIDIPSIDVQQKKSRLKFHAFCSVVSRFWKNLLMQAPSGQISGGIAFEFFLSLMITLKELYSDGNLKLSFLQATSGKWGFKEFVRLFSLVSGSNRYTWRVTFLGTVLISEVFLFIPTITFFQFPFFLTSAH